MFYNLVQADDKMRGQEMMEYMDAGGKYANRPNLLRVAVELAGSKDPDRAFEAMRLALKGGVDNFANAKKDLGLPVG